MPRMPLLFIALAMLYGCATQAIPLEEATSAPPERVYFPSSSDAVAAARVVFVRDRALTGAGVYQHLYINGERTADLDVGEKVEVRLPPGDYVLGVQPTDPFGLSTVN